MAKVPVYVWECDSSNCNAKYENRDQMAAYMSIPPGWAEVTITDLNEEEEECLCKCHEEEMDDDDDNVAGHESYNCEECPDEDDWHMEMTICPTCYQRFKMMWNLPRKSA
jgi:hypothetical protein